MKSLVLIIDYDESIAFFTVHVSENSTDSLY